MALFAWSDDLSVGNKFIDDDHRVLVKMVNDFHQAMQDGKGNEAVSVVLNNLAKYTQEHFRREEAEMQRIRYSKYLAHKLEHDKLLAEVTQLQASVSSGKTMLSIKVSKFLRDWLLTHIKQTDKLLSEALLRESGR